VSVGVAVGEFDAVCVAVGVEVGVCEAVAVKVGVEVGVGVFRKPVPEKATLRLGSSVSSLETMRVVDFAPVEVGSKANMKIRFELGTRISPPVSSVTGK
jgi:hypothetical protein